MNDSFYPIENIWTKVEKNKLQLLVSDYTNNNIKINWIAVSNFLSKFKYKRSPMECYIQYTNSREKRTWSKVEDESLLKIVHENNETNWAVICREFNKTTNSNTTPWQCFHHYQVTLNTTLGKNGEVWTEEEDFILKQSVEHYGDKNNWQHVANTLPGRSSFQCSIRWRRSLICNENLLEGKWSSTDEKRLFLAALACEAPLSTISKKSNDEILLLKAALGINSNVNFLSNTNTLTMTESELQNQLNQFMQAIHSDNYTKITNSSSSQNTFSWTNLAEMVPGK